MPKEIFEQHAFNTEGMDCCAEGDIVFASLEHAVLLKGEPGFDDITDDVIKYRKERCDVASGCTYLTTGECALRAAGMLSIFP